MIWTLQEVESYPYTETDTSADTGTDTDADSEQRLVRSVVRPGIYLKSPPAYLLSGWEGGEPPATVLSMGSANSSSARCSVPATASTIFGATKLLDTNSCSVSDDRLAMPPSGQIKGRPKAPVYATLCRPCQPERHKVKVWTAYVEADVGSKATICWVIEDRGPMQSCRPFMETHQQTAVCTAVYCKHIIVSCLYLATKACSVSANILL